jgi:hypothetical protein
MAPFPVSADSNALTCTFLEAAILPWVNLRGLKRRHGSNSHDKTGGKTPTRVGPLRSALASLTLPLYRAMQGETEYAAFASAGTGCSAAIPGFAKGSLRFRIGWDAILLTACAPTVYFTSRYT